MTMHDPAWDMPRINWQQQGSFEVGELALTANPDDEPLVCLPSINEHWLPIVLGCLDQLRNPSTWVVADDDAMAEILYKVGRLLQMFGARADCMCTLVRLESCQLQTSCDNGTTWTTVPGWDPGFAECVQEQIPVIGLPPNPGDEAPDQFACSIAGYLANDVILKALTQAITSITDDIALLGFGTVIVDLIPEFVLVTAAFTAFTIIYTAISEGTIADYEAARDDPLLWHDVQCAIYGCIVGDGYVKPGNFACIVAAIGAIPYIHSDVISLLVSFVEALGATGLAQLSQRAGLVPGADCSDCGDTWCYEWSNALGTMNDPPWGLIPGDTNPDPTGVFTITGSGIESKAYGATQQLHIYQEYTPGTLTSLTINVIVPEAANGAARFYSTKASTGHSLPGGAATDSWFFDGAAVDSPSDRLEIIIDSITSDTSPNIIQSIRLTGTGTSPFGASNCA